MLHSVMLGLKDAFRAKIFILVSAFLCAVLTTIFTSATQSALRFPPPRAEDGVSFNTYVVSTDIGKRIPYLDRLVQVYNHEDIVSVFRSVKLSRSFGRSTYVLLGNGHMFAPGIDARQDTEAYVSGRIDPNKTSIQIDGKDYSLHRLDHPFGAPIPEDEAERVIVLRLGDLTLSDMITQESEVSELLSNTTIKRWNQRLIQQFLQIANTGIYMLKQRPVSALEHDFVFGYLYPLLLAACISAFLSFITISRAKMLSLTRELSIHALCGCRRIHLLVRFGLLVAMIPLLSFVMVLMLINGLVSSYIPSFILINMIVVFVLFSYVALSLRQARLLEHLLEDQ